jgi:putative phosphoesterase
MFRLGVVSDSHGGLAMVDRVIPRLRGLDALVHLGDGADDARLIAEAANLPLFQVAGNGDFTQLPGERIEVFSGVRTLLTHGHNYRVKHSLLRLALRAREAEAALVLYGHTHIAAVDMAQGAVIINPGALMNGRYAVIEFRETGPCPILMRV